MSGRRWIVVCLWLVAPCLVAAQRTLPQAQLCIGSKGILRSTTAECQPVLTSMVRIPVSSSRLFILITADERNAIFGDFEPPVGTIDLSKTAGMPIPLRLVSSTLKWPKNPEIALKSLAQNGNEWRWNLTRNEAAHLRQIDVPGAVYEMTIVAERTEPVIRKIDTKAKPDLGSIWLRPWPFLAGTVIDRNTHAPLPGAVIASDSGKTIAVTDMTGSFREQLPPDLNPSAVNISSPGYGTRTIPLTKARANRTLPTIELVRAGTLRVRIGRDTTKYPQITLDVSRLENHRQIRIKTAKLTASQNQWSANDLDAGEFVVMVSGARPLQKLAKNATGRSGEETTIDLNIDPIDLLGSVARGGTGLADAQVTLKSSKYGWSADLTASDQGTFEEDLWQSGRFAALISAPVLTEPYLTAKEVADTPRAHLDIVIPSGRITGSVQDARTQEPIAGADVTLDSTLPDNTQRSVGTRTDDQGHFDFEGVAIGQHSLTAEAPKYLRNVLQPFQFTADGQAKDVVIALTPGDRFPVVVTAPDGTPVVGASIIQTENLFGQPPVTDADGRADVAVNSASGALLMIVPRSGSFALYRIPAGVEMPKEPTQIVVKPATGSVTVTAVDDSTSLPTGNANILVRYNGEFIGPFLGRLYGGLRGISFTTNQQGQFVWMDLPPGMYEFWSYGSLDEAADIMAHQPRAGAAVPVSTGSYSITLRFNTRP